MYRVVRLAKEDYDDLLDFLNSSFGYEREKGFETLLPAMWHRTDEHMGKHLAIKEDGHIVAAMGIYPLHVHVGKQDLLFATTGNIAVSPAYRNQGLMQQLMYAAFEELERLQVDVARLGGDRLRYARYGYEHAGNTIHYTMTPNNFKDIYRQGTYTFNALEVSDNQAISTIQAWQESSLVYTERGDNLNFYDSMTAFKSQPYIARDSTGQLKGCITASPDKTNVFECYGADDTVRLTLLCGWMAENGLSRLRFVVAPWEQELARMAGGICEHASIEYATQCYIRNWEHVISAYLPLKGNVAVEGSFVLAIEDYGGLEIDRDGCRKTNMLPDLTLDRLTATRFIFGHQAPDNVCELPADKAPLIRALFPLPFHWNNQDRV